MPHMHDILDLLIRWSQVSDMDAEGETLSEATELLLADIASGASPCPYCAAAGAKGDERADGCMGSL